MRFVGEAMRTILVDMFNNIIKKEEISEENFTSNITFLHKKGKTDDIRNYRTLATGCNIYKTFLKILANRIQKVTEGMNLLGNIQCGFRSGRRGAENLFILDTVIAHSKRNKSKTMIAMLDLKKAYDRICRDSLWYKLRMYGFPDGFVRVLELIYQESYGILRFQNVESEPVEIKLGLKQGCVLSPVLFSLYLADLGRVLENADVGLRIGDIRIPALFFADDMLIMNEEKDFQDLLHVVGEYASIWKLEFSGEKSVVIPTHCKISNTKRWQIGETPEINGEVREVYMKEVEESKYLGIIFRRKHNVYSSQHNKIKQNMFASMTTMQNIIGDILKPIRIIRDTWYVYVEPVITYGLESVGFTVNYLMELDKLQAQYLKNMLRLPRYVANEAVYLITNIRPISHTILMRRINFVKYVKENPQNLWVKKMLELQYSWVEEELLLIDETINRNTQPKGSSSYLMKEVARQIQNHPHLEDILKVKRKNDIKIAIFHMTRRWMNQKMEVHSTMRFMNEEWGEEDRDYHRWKHKWWLKMRTEGLFLNHRIKNKPEAQKCPMCLNNIETIEHFMWECTQLEHNKLWNELPMPLIRSKTTMLGWMLSKDRTEKEREEISDNVMKRWRMRCEKIRMEKESTDQLADETSKLNSDPRIPSCSRRGRENPSTKSSTISDGKGELTTPSSDGGEPNTVAENGTVVPEKAQKALRRRREKREGGSSLPLQEVRRSERLRRLSDKPKNV